MSRTVIFRALAIAVIGGAALASPPEAQASMSSMCQVCLGSELCPADLTTYDGVCHTYCGPWTYAGACREASGESPGNGCAWPTVAIVCYEPM